MNYIGKMKNGKLVVIWEETMRSSQLPKDTKLLSKHEISLNQLKEVFQVTEVGWIETAAGYLVNGELEVLDLYDTLYPTKPEDCKFKLVRFPNAEDPFIRICLKRSMKKNYKNTIILPNALINDFIKDAKKYEWTEIRKSANSKAYDQWSNYIDLHQTISK